MEDTLIWKWYETNVHPLFINGPTDKPEIMVEKESTKSSKTSGSMLPGLMLALVFIFFLGLALVETVVDQHPLIISDSGYLGPCLTAKKAIKEDISSFITFSHYVYPPLFFTISGGILPLENADRLSGKIVTLFWMLIGLAGMLLLLNMQFGIGGAILGLTTFVASPMFRIAIRHVNMDVAVFAIYPWLLFLLLKTRNFSLSAYSLLSGLILGMGFLIRWDFPILAVIPVFLVLINAIKKPQKNTISNILLFVLIPVCALIYFVVQFSDLPTADIASDEYLFNDNFSIESLTFYPYLIFKVFCGIGLSAMVVAAIILGLKTDRKNTLHFFGIFVWVLFIYTMIPNKNFKYMLLPTSLLCTLIPIVWVNHSDRWKLAILAILSLAVMPYVSTDWTGLDPRPLTTTKDETKNLYIRPIDMLDSNLKQYRRMLEELPGGERIVCVVDVSMERKNLTDDDNVLTAHASQVRSYADSMMDRSINAKQVDYSKKSWEGCDGLMVPSYSGFRPKIDLQVFRPLIITHGLDTSIVWFYSDNPDAVKPF